MTSQKKDKNEDCVEEARKSLDTIDEKDLDDLMNDETVKKMIARGKNNGK